MGSNAILSAVFFQGFAAFFLPIQNHFGWSRTAISGAFSLRQVEGSILGPLSGFMIDRVSARRLITAGAIISGVGLIALGALTNGIVTFYIFFMLVSVGAAGVGHGVTWPVVIARWFRRRLGLALGIAVLGPVITAPMIIFNTQMEEAVGWRAVLIVYGFIVAIGVTAMALIVRDRPESYGLLPDGDLRGPESPARDPEPEAYHGMTLGQALHTRAFWLIFLYLGGMFVANSGFQTHQVPYFVDDLGFSASSAAVTLTIVVFASGVGRVSSGYLLDVMDYRVVLGVMAIVMAASFVYLQVVEVSSLMEALPFTFLFGIAFGSTIPMRGALGSMAFGNRSLGSIIGVLQGSTTGAGVIGPLLMGIMFDWQGSYRGSIWVMAGVALVLLVPVAFMESRASLVRRTGAGMVRER